MRSEKANMVSEVLVFVNSNLTEQSLCLQMVANHFDVSSSLVSRIFAENYGIGFLDYINSKRVQKALDYLVKRDEEQEISQIAAQVGYTSDATFRRVFKKYVGVTPSRFRDIALSDTKHECSYRLLTQSGKAVNTST